MVRFIRFLLLCLVKCICFPLYRFQYRWLSDDGFDQVKEVRLLVFLNHTSLWEPIFVGGVPLNVLWRLSGDLLAPGADITLNDRAIVGRIYHSLFPGLIPISRNRDESWSEFMNLVDEDTLVAILPEGRMMRRNGLDKHGNPMTVRGGVADILQKKHSGKVMFVYSGGLHHIQAPGDKLPKIFQAIKANLEMMDIQDYKELIEPIDGKDFREKVVKDMQSRLESKIPR
jgi:1-acyl-sn-glycerol-3-phosphate acyltransferase